MLVVRSLRAPVLAAMLAGTTALFGFTALPAGAEASQPGAATDAAVLGAVLDRLGDYATRFEQIERRGSFLFRGKMEELDGDGRIEATKELVVRVIAKPSERITEIVRYVENGADKTSEAREKAGVKPAEEKKFRLPFLPSERARYDFAFLGRHPKWPHQVRIGFQPRSPAANTYAGSAWVDEPTGEVLTMGFSPSKKPMFVDRVDIQVRFDNLTSLGRAPSAISFEARGGLLVFKKHFRGSATLTDAKISF